MPDGERGIVDWGLALRLGRRLAGDSTSPLDEAEVRETSREALEMALAYTTLEPASPVPEVEVVSRDEWIGSNLAEFAKLLTPAEERLASELRLPGPLGSVARRALSAAAGAEAGAFVGYGSKRVLGQYQVSLRADEGVPRMLLVGANLPEATGKLGVDPDAFLLWVLVHEQTHSIQFGSVPWLREHLAGMVAELLESASSGLDLGALVGRARGLVDAGPQGGPAADPRRGADPHLRRREAGRGDGPHGGRDGRHRGLRRARDGRGLGRRAGARRSCASGWTRAGRRRTGLADLLARIMGMGAKLRQYELGKRWCDAVAAEAGIEGLDRVWESPEALPSLAELDDAQAWITRVLTPAAA